jgi:hypothetical protein
MRAADRTEATLRRGVDELQNRLEHTRRNRALKYEQQRYVKFALTFYRAIERANS